MELEQILIKVDELKDKLNGLRPLREDRLNKLNQKLRLEWNYHSNSIEGNTLSMSETKSFILWGITAKGKPFRDYVEMKGHNEALNKLYKIIDKDLTITESLLKEFHKIILVEPFADEKVEINPGEYKTIPNYLYTPTNERIDFATPEDVPQMMNSLINWLNNHITPPKRKKNKYNLHPLLIAAGFHSQFIKIHPFGDGNGRMARILTNLILMLCGYVPVIVKLDDRFDYYTAINTSQLNSPENLALFLGKSLINSLEMAIKAAKGESIEEDDDIDKELQLLDQKLKAKKNDIPTKSVEKIIEILKNNAFPFFDKVVDQISKFDHLYEKTARNIYLNNGATVESLEKRKTDILKKVSEDTNTIHLQYSLTGLKNTTSKERIDFNLRIDFNRGDYIIWDNIANQKLQLKYDEVISMDDQDIWIKNIQKTILERIKKIVNQ